MKRRPAGPLWLIVLLLGGCAATPFDYKEVGEMRPGPGLFSGSDGVFSLSTEDRDRAAAGNGGGGGRSTPAEYREFLEFQEFRRWKEANRDTPAYREFQAWREWKALRSTNGGPK